MKLENQVVSLELAKKIKELGFKQDSLWIWVDKFPCFNDKARISTKTELKYKMKNATICFSGQAQNLVPFYSAYTVAELGEMLPLHIELTHPRDYQWKIVYRQPLQIKEGEIRSDTWGVEADTEANARAKMWLYLKFKEKLL